MAPAPSTSLLFREVSVADSVTLKITRCGECPHHKVGHGYSLDGFDHGCDWTCSLAKREIAGFVERSSQEPKEIPNWCPLRKLEPSP